MAKNIMSDKVLIQFYNAHTIDFNVLTGKKETT